MGLFSLFAKPLGYVMRWIYLLVPSYVLTILLFTFLVRLILFPLSIKNQKSQVDRARLAPRLERIQKKYANDRQKLQEKQQQLYEKEGVKMTAGCLPMIVNMLVLFSVIAVIYKPLTYIQQFPEEQINTCIEAIQDDLLEDVKAELKDKDLSEKDYKKQYDEQKKKIEQKYTEKSYYRELYMLKEIGNHRDSVIAKLEKTCDMTPGEATTTLTTMEKVRDEFAIFGVSLLDMPNETGLKPNWLWLIAIASGVAALLQSIISMRYSKAAMSEEQQKMSGMSNGCMMYGMPIFSLVIAFTVPGGVALYWVFSNLLGIVQTVALNAMYNPAKARQQTEVEYAERRRKKAEDKARLRAARLEEQAAWQREENEKKAAAKGQGKKKPQKPVEEPADTPEEPVNEIPTEE